MKINEKIGACRDIGRYRQILRIMKLTILIITVFLMQVSASSNAQITLSARKESLRKVLKSISKQSGYDLVYTDQDLSKALPVNLNLENASIENALSACFEGQPLVYKILDKTVMVKKKEMPSFLDRIIDRFAAVDVRGRVLDEAGNPLVGATIQVKGKALAYKTNDKGEFEIKGVDEDAVLLVSYVGFKTLEISLKDAVMPLEIKLNVATGELEEVNVTYSTGYQNIPKERATGSFVQINNETINRSVSTNILDRLTGVTSGLNFEPIKPGNPTTLSIRGISTINANINPLIVVDGFPYDESANFQNIINSLNPHDVENITILKDAAAASIWGVRAGNGVIVITTKKGKYDQKTAVQLSSNLTIGDKPDLFYKPILAPSDYLNLEQKLFAQGVYDANLNNTFSFPVVSQGVEIFQKLKQGKITQIQADEQLNALKTQDLRNDINKYLLQKSLNQQYGLNLSGGGTRYNYFSSVGFDKNRSSSVKDEYSRLTLRFDNAYKLLENLQLSGFIAYTQNENKGTTAIAGTQLLNLTKVTSYTGLSDINGNPSPIPYDYRISYIDTAKYPALLDWKLRPLDELNLNRNNLKSYDVRVGAGLKYTLMSGVSADVKYQYQRIQNTGELYNDVQSYFVRDLVNRYMSRNRSDGSIRYNIPIGGIIGNNSASIIQWNFRGQIGFDQSWAKHTVNAIVGTETRELVSKRFSQREYGFDVATGIFKPQINYDSLYRVRLSGSLARIPNVNGYDATTNRYLSYYSNAAYTYNSRYVISGSARLDGSNFFGVKANQRIVPLWSAGLAWNISNEEFYNRSLVSYLKLRVTYGYNGNTNNSATGYATMTYSSSQSTLNSLPYGDISSAPNPQLRWERVKVINLGLDYSIKNFITGSVEYYNKQGLDLIGPIEVDPTTGVGSFSGNRANIRGKGVDIILNSQNTSGAIKWSSNLLFSYTSEKVTSYSFPATSANAKIESGIVLKNPLYSIYSYKWAGLSPTTGDPQVYLADTISSFNNISRATVEDVVFHGSSKPKVFGSFRNTFTWNNISLSFNVLYKFNYYFRRSSINYGTLLNVESWNSHLDYLHRWMQPGDEKNTNIPSLPILNNTLRDNAYLKSDLMIEKGDHIRLQDIRLSYSLNKNHLKKIPFNSAQIFIYGNNLAVLWRANEYGIDPDFGDNMNGYYPTPRTFSFGLTLGL